MTLQTQNDNSAIMYDVALMVNMGDGNDAIEMLARNNVDFAEFIRFCSTTRHLTPALLLPLKQAYLSYLAEKENTFQNDKIDAITFWYYSPELTKNFAKVVYSKFSVQCSKPFSFSNYSSLESITMSLLHGPKNVAHVVATFKAGHRIECSYTSLTKLKSHLSTSKVHIA